jgi:hypothetical protein
MGRGRSTNGKLTLVEPIDPQRSVQTTFAGGHSEREGQTRLSTLSRSIYTAILDRLVHHSQAISIDGPSWRVRQHAQLNRGSFSYQGAAQGSDRQVDVPGTHGRSGLGMIAHPTPYTEQTVDGRSMRRERQRVSLDGSPNTGVEECW